LKPFQIFQPFERFVSSLNTATIVLFITLSPERVFTCVLPFRREHPRGECKVRDSEKQVGELRILFNKSTESPNWLLFRSRKLMPTFRAGESGSDFAQAAQVSFGFAVSVATNIRTGAAEDEALRR
jgi:hypothetical protein